MTRDWQLWEDEKIVAALDDYWKKPVFVRHRREVERIFQQVKERDPDSQTLLDFGCGTGIYLSLAEGKGFTYSGVDVTAEMLRTAREKHPGREFNEDDILDSRTADEAFDITFSADVIVHLPEFDKPFATLYRIARRHVIIKLCYLTRRAGLMAKLRPDPPTFHRRTREGFIEHFYNLDELKEKIAAYAPGSATHAHVFKSGQKISDFQAILVVTKPGAPPPFA